MLALEHKPLEFLMPKIVRFQEWLDKDPTPICETCFGERVIPCSDCEEDDIKGCYECGFIG